MDENATVKALIYDANRARVFDATLRLSDMVEGRGKPGETYLLFGYEHEQAKMGTFHRGRIVTDARMEIHASGFGPGDAL